MLEVPHPLDLTVVGAGGLGIPAAWAALRAWPPTSKLRLTIVEPDDIDPSNLNRQVLYRPEDVGKKKAACLAQALSKQALREIEFRLVEEYLEPDNIERILGPADFVIDATDSPRAKFLINDFCVSSSKPFCYGGVTAWDGQLLAWRPGGGCLRCLFGNLTSEEIESQNRSCQSAGIIGAAAGSVGALQGTVAAGFLTRGELWSASTEFDSLFVRVGPRGVKRSFLAADVECPLGCAKRLRRLDLSSKRCPETFLYTKLAMEDVPFGEALQVAFSDPDSPARVASSLAEEGFKAIVLSEGRILVSRRERDR